MKQKKLNNVRAHKYIPISVYGYEFGCICVSVFRYIGVTQKISNCIILLHLLMFQKR